MTTNNISARTADYARANDTNPLMDPTSYYDREFLGMRLAELAARGGRITRVRWIGNEYVPGRGRCWDLSYIHAELPDGSAVRLEGLPAAYLIPRHAMKGELIAWAKEEGVFAKGVGLLDTAVWSILS